MLKVENPLVLEHQLSKRTINILQKHIAMSLHGIMNRGEGWLLGERPLPIHLQEYINKKLKPLGFQLYKGPKGNSQQNAILAYQRVHLHDDKGLGYAHSTVFIPLDIPGVGRFLNYGSDRKMRDLTISTGDVIIFDQNNAHTIAFPDDEDFEVKYGIALFLDKIEDSTHQDSTPSSLETV